MYAKYLTNMCQLAFIVGQLQIVNIFKKLLDYDNSKASVFYKCMEQMPANSYLSSKQEQDGILEIDWLQRHIDRDPQMIIMPFNCTAQLSNNQVWQDRLTIILKKINKVSDILRSRNKQQVVLKVIVIVSKYTFGGVNVNDKVSNYLRSYQKQTFVFQQDLLQKQLTKNRPSWLSQLEKNYQRKYKKFDKKMELSFVQKRISCLLKMAFISQILPNKDSNERYREIYTSLQFRFSELLAHSLGPDKLARIQQTRQVMFLATQLGDIILLRRIKLAVRTTKSVYKLAYTHLDSFRNRGLNIAPPFESNTAKLYYYVELVWRHNFLQHLLELIYRHDIQTPLCTLCELINTFLSSLLQRTKLEEADIPPGKYLPYGNQNYVGLYSYALQGAGQDIIHTELSNIYQQKSDNLKKGVQLILRYKQVKQMGANQKMLLDVYLIRFYAIESRVSALIPIFNSVVATQMTRRNYYLLNELFKEVMNLMEQAEGNGKMTFYAVCTLICDFFHSRKLNTYLSKLLKTECLEPQQYPLNYQSGILAASVLISKPYAQIDKVFSIGLHIKTNSLLKGYKLYIRFNHPELNRQHILAVAEENITIEISPTVLCNAFKGNTISSSIEIRQLRYSDEKVTWILPAENIQFKKHTIINLITKIKQPQFQVIIPYDKFYINELSQINILIQLIGCQIIAKCAFYQQNKEDGRTQFYLNLDTKQNLTNTKYQHHLQIGNVNNKFWMKLNKPGKKKIKISLHFQVFQQIYPKQSFTIKYSYSLPKEVVFQVESAFNIIKIFKLLQSGSQLKNKQIPINKKVVGEVQIMAKENVIIKELGMHRNPTKIQYIKDIKVQNMKMNANTKLQQNMIFMLSDNCKNQTDLFLTSIYLKWQRLNCFYDVQNLHIEKQTKIDAKNDELAFQFKSDHQLTRKELNHLSVKFYNLSNRKLEIYCMMENGDSFLRVGEKGKGIKLESNTTQELHFAVVPLKSGYLEFPEVKIYLEGVEQPSKTKNSLIKVI